jgi:WD40 repeat protein
MGTGPSHGNLEGVVEIAGRAVAANQQAHPHPGGHSDLVKAVAISPDGKTAVSGSEDQAIKAWTLDAGVSGLACTKLISRQKYVYHSTITLKNRRLWKMVTRKTMLNQKVI